MEKLIKAYGFRGFLMVFSGFFLFNIIIFLGGGGGWSIMSFSEVNKVAMSK